MLTYGQLASSTLCIDPASPETLVRNTLNIRGLGVAVSLACCSSTAAAAAECISNSSTVLFLLFSQEFEGEIPPYPYMRMRTRAEHPWGELGLFEIHRHVGEKP